MIADYVSNRKLFPCYQCTRRKIGCHGSCPDYKKAAAANAKTNQRVRDQFLPDQIEHEPLSTTFRRWTKRKKGYVGRGEK